jgi:hypothetical protein
MIKKPSKASVQTGLRIREELWRELNEEAKANQHSINSEIVARLERSLASKSLLGEVLTLAYGERWAKIFVAAQKSGKLRINDKTEAAMKAAVQKVFFAEIEKLRKAKP